MFCCFFYIRHHDIYFVADISKVQNNMNIHRSAKKCFVASLTIIE